MLALLRIRDFADSILRFVIDYLRSEASSDGGKVNLAVGAIYVVGFFAFSTTLIVKDVAAFLARLWTALRAGQSIPSGDMWSEILTAIGFGVLLLYGYLSARMLER